MLRSTRRGLETWHGRDRVTLADERARQQGTQNSTYTGAPVLDPTCEGGRVRFPSATRLIVHCRSEAEARTVLEAIRGRLAECGLELHSTKTKIVYCKDDDRPGKHDQIKFDFLGYTFQPRRARNRWGGYF